MPLFSNSPIPVQKVSIAIDPASLAAYGSVETDVAFPGVRAGDVVSVQVPASLEAGLSFSGVRIKADDVVSIRMSNHSNAAVDGASRVWIVQLIKAA